jgi:hypothetical protein
VFCSQDKDSPKVTGNFFEISERNWDLLMRICDEVKGKGVSIRGRVLGFIDIY